MCNILTSPPSEMSERGKEEEKKVCACLEIITVKKDAQAWLEKWPVARRRREGWGGEGGQENKAKIYYEFTYLNQTCNHTN